MSGGYPHNPPGYGYGPPPPQSYSSYAPSAPQQPYGAPSAPYGASSAPYGGASSAPYGGASSAPYGGASSAPYGGASSAPYGGASSAPYGGSSAPSAPSAPYGAKPQKENKPSGSQPSAPGYGSPQHYGAPPTAQPYGGPQTAQPYGGPQTAQPYGGPPTAQPYGGPPTAQPYGGPPTTQPYGGPPTAQSYGGAQPYGAPQPYGAGPFAGLVSSTFPHGTDPTIIACFQLADQDGSGVIDDYELQKALSSYNQSFSMRTVHLLMYNFTNSNTRKIGPKEFTALYYGLQNWRSIFETFDRDRSGKIDVGELGEALLSLGFSASPVVLDLLVSKFDKTGGKSRAIEYDNFIECCLTVKGLTEKFKEKDTAYSGSATFTYESFMLTVLPFLIA